MNSPRFNSWSRVPALILLALTASAAQATARCETPTHPVDRVACAKAKESPEALRRYIQRTQPIYMLYFWDYMSEADLERYHARRQTQTRDVDAGKSGERY